jgi:hypothetical protein
MTCCQKKKKKKSHFIRIMGNCFKVKQADKTSEDSGKNSVEIPSKIVPPENLTRGKVEDFYEIGPELGR